MRLFPAVAALAAVALVAGCSSGGSDSQQSAPPWQFGGPAQQQHQRSADPTDDYLDALDDAGIFVPRNARADVAETGELICLISADGTPASAMYPIVDRNMADFYTRSQRRQIVDLALETICPRQA